MKIHTVTLNPALDLSGHVRELLPNEKNYVSRPRLDPGGNGVNAARMIARLGVPVKLMGFLGGAPGAQIGELLQLESRRLRLSFVRIFESTRTNVTVTNDSDRNQTRLTFPSPRISASERKQLLAQISQIRGGGLLSLGGSIPASCSLSYLCRLLNQARQMELGLIVDIPAVHLGPLLARQKSRFLMIKPNQHELEAVLGRKLASRDDIHKAALGALRHSALVCVSLGSEGAVLAAQGRIWEAQPLKILARGSVGAGDSMVGAMATRLLALNLCNPEAVDHAAEVSIRDVFTWGLAAGAATAEVEGTALGSATRIRALAPRVKIRKTGARE